MEPSLATSVGKIQLDKPAMLASGILGISLDVFNRLYRSGAGAVVTKSLSSEPWEGYPNPTIFSVNGGGWMNAVGLSNPGASNFAKMIESNKDVPIIVSLVGSIPEDFEMMINEFKNCNIVGIENNETIYDGIKDLYTTHSNIKLLKKSYIDVDETNKYDLIIGNPPYFVIVDKKEKTNNNNENTYYKTIIDNIKTKNKLYKSLILKNLQIENHQRHNLILGIIQGFVLELFPFFFLSKKN